MSLVLFASTKLLILWIHPPTRTTVTIPSEKAKAKKINMTQKQQSTAKYGSSKGRALPQTTSVSSLPKMTKSLIFVNEDIVHGNAKKPKRQKTLCSGSMSCTNAANKKCKSSGQSDKFFCPFHCRQTGRPCSAHGVSNGSESSASGRPKSKIGVLSLVPSPSGSEADENPKKIYKLPDAHKCHLVCFKKDQRTQHPSLLTAETLNMFLPYKATVGLDVRFFEILDKMLSNSDKRLYMNVFKKKNSPVRKSFRLLLKCGVGERFLFSSAMSFLLDSVQWSKKCTLIYIMDELRRKVLGVKDTAEECEIKQTKFSNPLDLLKEPIMRPVECPGEEEEEEGGEQNTEEMSNYPLGIENEEYGFSYFENPMFSIPCGHVFERDAFIGSMNAPKCPPYTEGYMKRQELSDNSASLIFEMDKMFGTVRCPACGEAMYDARDAECTKEIIHFYRDIKKQENIVKLSLSPQTLSWEPVAIVQ